MYKKLLKSIQDQAKKPKHSEHIRGVAESYAKNKGFDIKHPKKRARVNPDRAKKIAEAYHQMEHNPDHPEVKRSYNALINETLDQFEHIKNNTDMKFSKIKPGMKNPYASSKDLHRDIRENNHMWYFPTEQGFGSDDQGPQDHPMLKPTKHEHNDGSPMVANDVFRIVHDYFGHSKEGNGFGPHGEEHAWHTHKQMYSPAAQKAMTTETRGQNSWVNFGPHAEHNRSNPSNTIYANQKAGILPDWAHEHDEHDNFGQTGESKNNINKSEGNDNSVKNQKPHFIFSAENPLYEDRKKIKMNHDQVIDFLRNKGYNAESMHGHYGSPEKSIIVHNPPKHSVDNLLELSQNLGQESSIYSDGYNHEMHYHHGPNAGTHHKGQGTNFHKKPPEDLYSSIDGTHFTHNFNFDETHPHEKSMLHEDENINKSEFEDDKEMWLEHYSPKEGLESIDPKHMSSGVDTTARHHKMSPDNHFSFYYPHGYENPEKIVTQGSKSKYTVKAPDRNKIFDAKVHGNDVIQEVKEQNQGAFNLDHFVSKLKEKGYHGFRSRPSGLDMVAMFHELPVHSEEPIKKSEVSGAHLKKLEILTKGSLQRKNPFRAEEELGDDEKYSMTEWSESSLPSHRDDIPRMEGEGRFRSLHKLHGKTKVKKHPETGKRYFLMHRGMGGEERTQQHFDDKAAYGRGMRTSWTPNYHEAQNLATDHIVSAWIPEDEIHMDMDQYLGHDNPNKGELEYIVRHSGDAYQHAHPDTVKETISPLYSAQKNLQSRITSRGKSREEKFNPYKKKDLDPYNPKYFKKPKSTENKDNNNFTGTSASGGIGNGGLAASERYINISGLHLKRMEIMMKGDFTDKLKAGALGVATAASMASPKQAPAQQVTQQLNPPKQEQVIEQQSPKQDILQSIRQVESSGGRDTAHAKLPESGIHRGERAYGSYGLTPLLIRETVSKHPDLQKEHGVLTRLHGQKVHDYMRKNPELEHELASRHYDRLAEHFGHDPAKIGHAWLNGITGTKRAINKGRNIKDHWHVKKILDAYEDASKD